MREAIRSRLAALFASAILAALGSQGMHELPPGLGSELQVWASHTFDLLLFLGYAVIHPWLQARTNPTGAFTADAARRLERVAERRRESDAI